MIAPDGVDEPRCLNYSDDTNCKTMSYPINWGYSSICMHDTFYNMSESIELLDQPNLENGANILCKNCVIGHSSIDLFCIAYQICRIFLKDLVIRESVIGLSNIYISFRNATLEEVLIHDLPNHLDTATNQIQFEDSSLYCYEQINCGLKLGNISAVKLVMVRSNLDQFGIHISVSQLMFICHETHINMPYINVHVESLEYFKIPAYIKFDKVNVVRNTAFLTEKEVSSKSKRNAKLSFLDYVVTFKLTNPYIFITKSSFNGVHLEIHSQKQHFKSAFFLLILERTRFINSSHIGNGGGLAILSDIQNSDMTILDCIFSNNSAIKGKGDVRGQGGGLYVSAKSSTLVMTDCHFQANTASDSGLALYTTEGVIVSLTNCTFWYDVDPIAIQRAILYIAGHVNEFIGLVQVFNEKPEWYIGDIDVFFIRQAEELDISVDCPIWYNHLLMYSTDFPDRQSLPDSHYMCTPCSDNQYTPDMETKRLSYYGREEKLSWNNASDSCLQCPYGALCTGNNVNPRPNYWGYWHEGELVFQQCPAGYCCSGSESNLCSVYDYCPGNRTGTLCGACHEDFSVSIISGACTPDSQCGGDQWFWVIALMTTTAYVLWYTLKDNIFSLVLSSVRFMTNICKQSDIKTNDVSVGTKPSISSLNENSSSRKCSYGRF